MTHLPVCALQFTFKGGGDVLFAYMKAEDAVEDLQGIISALQGAEAGNAGLWVKTGGAFGGLDGKGELTMGLVPLLCVSLDDVVSVQLLPRQEGEEAES